MFRLVLLVIPIWIFSLLIIQLVIAGRNLYYPHPHRQQITITTVHYYYRQLGLQRLFLPRPYQYTQLSYYYRQWCLLRCSSLISKYGNCDNDSVVVSYFRWEVAFQKRATYLLCLKTRNVQYVGVRIPRPPDDNKSRVFLMNGDGTTNNTSLAFAILNDDVWSVIVKFIGPYSGVVLCWGWWWWWVWWWVMTILIRVMLCLRLYISK